jgi:predicted nuclease with TOPRIM domain
VTEIDTSAEEVERLCHNLEVAHRAGDGDEDLPSAAATLRALVGDRDELRAMVLAQREQAEEGAAANAALAADRDRLAARVEELEEALRQISEERSASIIASPWKELERLASLAERALAGGARDE